MSIDTILNIMNKYKLTADELLLVYLTFLAQTENGNTDRNSIYFKKWYDGGGNERLKSLFISLKEKGIIKKNYCPDSYQPDEIEFNSIFIKQYFKLSGELGKDLLDNYPSNLYVNGKNLSLKNISKRFLEQDEFYFWYAKSINHDKIKHQEIIKMLNWAKENNLITVSVIEFVASRKWEEFNELRIKGIEGRSDTFDIYTTA